MAWSKRMKEWLVWGRRGKRTKINPVPNGPNVMEEEKGIKSICRIEKGWTRHCGHPSFPTSPEVSRYVVVMFIAIFSIMPFARPIIGGTAKDMVTT